MVAAVGAFFQTSTDIIGYGAAPGFGNVGAYVATFANAQAPIVPPGPPARLFSGVAANGLDLNYITLQMIAAAAANTGQPIPATLFLQAIQGGSLGRTNGRIFSDSFRQLLAAMPAPQAGAVLYSIVDHNSCHQLSIALTEYAFLRAAPAGQRVRLIFNFDNHSDFGNVNVPGNGILQCGAWGVWCVRPVPGLFAQPFATAYIHLGWPQAPNLQIAWAGAANNTIGAPQGALAPVPPAAQLQVGAPVNPAPLLNYFATIPNWNWNNVDVYVSVDRDFMSGSYTPYGDGHYTAANGRMLVANLLNGLSAAGARLVGFDVVGLPAISGWTNLPLQPPALLTQAQQDVQGFYQNVLNY
jgi:hypothetical protein